MDGWRNDKVSIWSGICLLPYHYKLLMILKGVLHYIFILVIIINYNIIINNNNSLTLQSIEAKDYQWTTDHISSCAVSTLTPPAVAEFLHPGYRYESETTQMPYISGWHRSAFQGLNLISLRARQWLSLCTTVTDSNNKSKDIWKNNLSNQRKLPFSHLFVIWV